MKKLILAVVTAAAGVWLVAGLSLAAFGAASHTQSYEDGWNSMAISSSPPEAAAKAQSSCVTARQAPAIWQKDDDVQEWMHGCEDAATSGNASRH